MTLILGGTFLAGLIATRLLMDAGVDRLAVRYLLSVGAAYFAFLVLIRLWLAYVGSGGYDFTGDAVEAGEMLVPDVPAPRFRGGGSDGSWGKLDLAGDLEDALVIVLLLVVVVCLCGFAIYFIYTAPALLSEVAFEAALAATLARRTRQATSGGWMGSVFRATVWPFLVVLILSGLLGWAAQRKCPEARRLREALSCARPASAGATVDGATIAEPSSQLADHP